MFPQQIKMSAINMGFGRVIVALIIGLALGLGVTLWLGTEGGWYWWTAWLPGWLLSLAAMVLMLLFAAPDDGRATRPYDPGSSIAANLHGITAAYSGDQALSSAAMRASAIADEASQRVRRGGA